MTSWCMSVHTTLNLNISNSRQNINKLIKHKICTMNLSFQNTKNMFSSPNIQGEKGKNNSSSPRQGIKNITAFICPKTPLSKNLKICFLASKLRGWFQMTDRQTSLLNLNPSEISKLTARLQKNNSSEKKVSLVILGGCKKSIRIPKETLVNMKWLKD